jgi:hypothetical protein
MSARVAGNIDTLIGFASLEGIVKDQGLGAAVAEDGAQ